VRAAPEVALVFPLGPVVDVYGAAIAPTAAAPELGVQALDGLCVEPGQRDRAERRPESAADVPGVLVGSLGLHVELGEPAVCSVAEVDLAAGGAPGVLLREELRQQLLGLVAGRSGAGEVHTLSRHGIGADVHADLEHPVALPDPAPGSALALLSDHASDGSSVDRRVDSLRETINTARR
jgi:hypothetical protein